MHSYLPNTNDLCNVFVMTEWNDKRQSWTKELDNTTSVCLTREINDNSTRFYKQTVMSILAGVQKMRFVFVQRCD